MENIRDNVPDEWAKEAVEWAINNGILVGDSNGDYMLHRNCTRQEMLVFISRFNDLIKEK